MTGLRRNFKASKFADRMCASGKDCIAVTIEGKGKEIGKEIYFDWEKETVYMRKGNNFLEYAETSTGTWFKVTNEDTILKLQNEFANQRNS